MRSAPNAEPDVAGAVLAPNLIRVTTPELGPVGANNLIRTP